MTVPAGRFEVTSRCRGRYPAWGRSDEFPGWYSSLVAINGAVRTEGGEGRNVAVLLAFGFDGTPRM